MNAMIHSAGGERIILRRPDGVVEIEECRDSMREVTARPHGAPSSRFVTAYPAKLIEAIVEVKGVAWVCDEISRDEDPESIQRFFENDFLPYVSRADFAGKRILDFGCGSGSSTMVLARMFPDSRIVGLELSPEYVAIARARLAFYGYPNVEFQLSPSGTSLPQGLGTFDFIVMSAVFEHLLPGEGTQPVAETLQYLASIGWDGNVVAEVNVRQEKDEQYRLEKLIETVSFAREHLSQEHATREPFAIGTNLPLKIRQARRAQKKAGKA